ncbi:hypothetical protein K469DRAFT_716502 [Zopfia rhizophila CBS 207.26]|uniref:Zn(2)-C6 fungal-type domain-containing protein n=1 Tax=Zopfia rhizophila CBS 207.26 TaxID=1314779 RepID=A0A6A6DLI0_9PEZI|nr:hypothetical protein K469DRAFT_716502 [Zopfia rhizophila CBS 207.26]
MLPSPQSETRFSATTHSRPIKLRTACNQCCSAKVKCSGERTGCERCQNLGTQCIYAESRVGKVPGIRAKKKRSQNDIDRPQPDRRPSYAVSQNKSPIPSAEPTFREDPPESIMQWASDSQFEPTENCSDFLDDPNIQVAPQGSNTDPSGSDESIVTSSAADDFPLPAIDFGFDDLFPSPLPLKSPPPPPLNPPISAPMRHIAENTLPPHIALQAETKQRKEMDNQCVVECCQIISDLESYILAELKAFKLALGIVRRAIEKLMELISFQQSSRNLRCMMLFNTIMYQILELLELCHATLSIDSQLGSGLTSTSRTHGLLMPSLGFGDFCIDVEEQSAWRAQMILKEVHQGSEALRKIKTLASVGPDASGTAKAREHCLADLEIRLKDLAVRIARRDV